MNTSKRTLFAIGAFAIMLPFGVSGATAAGIFTPGTTAASGFATPLDKTIDRYLQQVVAAGRYSVSEAMVAREQLQMQFSALSRTEQAKLLSSSANLTSTEAVQAAIESMNAATVAEARAALAEVQAAQTGNVNARAQGLAPKLGGDGDSVFLATVGPCRIYDSRLGPGMLAGGASRQVWTMSIFNGYDFSSDQGGTGVTGSGNCQPMAFFGTLPVSVVATVTVINSSVSGALRAWNGGPTLTVGAVLAWNGGDRSSNTTVIPMDRTLAAYPASGSKRDIGINNNSGGAIDFVIDVVGYFIENQATALDCTNNTNTSTTTTAVDVLMTASACPAGYTATGVNCASSGSGGNFVSVIKSFMSPLGGGVPTTGTCRFENLGGASQTYWGYLTCCRVPGR